MNYIKNNKWLFISLGLITVGVIAYVVYDRRRKKRVSTGSVIEPPKPILPGSDVTNVASPNPSNLPTETRTNVDTNSRPYKHITGQINKWNELFSDIESRGKDILWYKKENREVGKSMKNTLYMSVTRNIDSWKKGITEDTTINQETKNFLNDLINKKFEPSIQLLFPADIYNRNAKWYTDALKNITPTDFYNK